MAVINAIRSLACKSRLARSYTSMPPERRRNRTKATFNVEGPRLLSSGRSSGQGRQPIRGQRPEDPKPGGVPGFAPKWCTVYLRFESRGYGQAGGPGRLALLPCSGPALPFPLATAVSSFAFGVAFACARPLLCALRHVLRVPQRRVRIGPVPVPP
jgi:hypothetical protein